MTMLKRIKLVGLGIFLSLGASLALWAAGTYDGFYLVGETATKYQVELYWNNEDGSQTTKPLEADKYDDNGQQQSVDDAVDDVCEKNPRACMPPEDDKDRLKIML
jgi:hypothetical protein